ncbi:MAG: hypothetical protein LBR80_01435, partial [Deltaproteobacteria bacterium]|nr:hypothetical protein [Deltaproteobacteria bacterium]
MRARKSSRPGNNRKPGKSGRPKKLRKPPKLHPSRRGVGMSIRPETRRAKKDRRLVGEILAGAAGASGQ